MRRVAMGIFAACTMATPLSAQTVFFDGAIGKAPVFGSLSRDGDNLTGWYLYTRYGKQIELQGKVDKAKAFHLDESSFDTAKKTGAFDGRIANGVWSGTWKNADGNGAAAFTFTENHDTLAKLSGDFRCSEHHTDKKYGYVYDRSARVTFTGGKLTRLDLVQESKGSDGDTQGCYIGLKDLKRVPGDGVTLRGVGDVPEENMAHCTVRVVGSAGFIYVGMGDTAEDGNDCKGAADVMFCSPRANFGDFMIDKSGVCKPAD